MQKLTIIGNLTASPEIRETASGASVCTFTVAVNRRFVGASGERQTDFFRVQAWRGLGESCAKYLSKGKKVAVLGELRARLYTDKRGETRMSLDVNAEEVEFLSPREAVMQEAEAIDDWSDIDTSDLPFGG